MFQLAFFGKQHEIGVVTQNCAQKWETAQFPGVGDTSRQGFFSLIKVTQTLALHMNENLR